MLLYYKLLKLFRFENWYCEVTDDRVLFIANGFSVCGCVRTSSFRFSASSSSSPKLLSSGLYLCLLSFISASYCFIYDSIVYCNCSTIISFYFFYSCIVDSIFYNSCLDSALICSLLKSMLSLSLSMPSYDAGSGVLFSCFIGVLKMRRCGEITDDLCLIVDCRSRDWCDRLRWSLLVFTSGSGLLGVVEFLFYYWKFLEFKFSFWRGAEFIW